MGCDVKGPGYGKPVLPYPELHRKEALELLHALEDGSFNPDMRGRDLFGYVLLPLLRRVESLEQQVARLSRERE